MDVHCPQIGLFAALALQNSVSLKVNGGVCFVECGGAPHIAKLGDGDQGRSLQSREKVDGPSHAGQTGKGKLCCVRGQNGAFVCQVHREGTVCAPFVFEMG